MSALSLADRVPPPRWNYSVAQDELRLVVNGESIAILAVPRGALVSSQQLVSPSERLPVIPVTLDRGDESHTVSIPHVSAKYRSCHIHEWTTTSCYAVV